MVQLTFLFFRDWNCFLSTAHLNIRFIIRFSITLPDRVVHIPHINWCSQSWDKQVFVVLPPTLLMSVAFYKEGYLSVPKLLHQNPATLAFACATRKASAPVRLNASTSSHLNSGTWTLAWKGFFIFEIVRQARLAILISRVLQILRRLTSRTMELEDHEKHAFPFRCHFVVVFSELSWLLRWCWRYWENVS